MARNVVAALVCVACLAAAQPAGARWTSHAAAYDAYWIAVTFGNNQFVAMSTAFDVMTSVDGTSWTNGSLPAQSMVTGAVCYDTGLCTNMALTHGSGTFVAISSRLPELWDATAFAVRTSATGTSWASEMVTIAGHGGLLQWQSVAHGNGTFVAVSLSGDVMRSADGQNWTMCAATEAIPLGAVAYGNGMFVALAIGSAAMTSVDGCNWTNNAHALPYGNWVSLAYGNGVFVAVALIGTVMTSADALTWQAAVATSADAWTAVTFGNGTFVAVAFTGNAVMTSTDGMVWTRPPALPAGAWTSVAYGNGVFVAVSSNISVLTAAVATTTTTSPDATQSGSNPPGTAAAMLTSAVATTTTTSPDATQSGSNPPGTAAATYAVVGVLLALSLLLFVLVLLRLRRGATTARMLPSAAYVHS